MGSLPTYICGRDEFAVYIRCLVSMGFLLWEADGDAPLPLEVLMERVREGGVLPGGGDHFVVQAKKARVDILWEPAAGERDDVFFFYIYGGLLSRPHVRLAKELKSILVQVVPGIHTKGDDPL